MAPAARERPLARALRALTALSAAAGTLLMLGLTASGRDLEVPTRPGLFDLGTDALIGRIADVASYFTEWSNVLVAVVFALLAVRVAGRGTTVRVLYFDALAMIIVTGVIYTTMLAPAMPPRHGLELVATTLEHTVTPVLAVIAWLTVGPHRWIERRLVPWAMVVPIVWLAFTLIRGGVIGAYPYWFLNVAALGYAFTLLVCGALVAGGIAVCFGLIAIDRLAVRWFP